MANSVITLDNVSFRYPDAGRDALSGVSLSIEAGSFIAVLGHNGSGKSTLAKLLNAILVPTEGTVTVKGMDTRSEENLLNVRRTVGMVFQNPDNQIVASVVEDDVAFAPENLGVSPAEIRRRVDEALKRVGMYEFRNNAPHLLSGGQKQRVAIAGVLAMQPEILVMDEPTAMLDPSGRQEVLRTIADLRAATGVTVVLITHHMDECIDADRLLVVSDGKLVLDGVPKDVFSRVEQMRSIGLDVPATTETLYELRAAGADVPLGALSDAEKQLPGRFALAIPMVLSQRTLETLNGWANAFSSRIDATYLSNVADFAFPWPGILKGDAALNAASNAAVLQLRQWGCAALTPSLELTSGQIDALGGGRELIVQGRIPLMQLRHCPYRAVHGLKGRHADCRRCDACAPSERLDGRALTDRTGAEFPLRRRASDDGCVVELMNSVPLNTLRRIRRLPKADAWRLLIDDADELKILLPLYRAAARGEDPRMLPEWSAIEKMDTTTGHYFRGVE